MSLVFLSGLGALWPLLLRTAPLLTAPLPQFCPFLSPSLVDNLYISKSGNLHWLSLVLVQALDVLNRGLRFVAIRIATGLQRFQIARFESHGQKPFESQLKRLTFLGKLSNRAIRFATDLTCTIRDSSRAIRDI